MSIIEKAVAKLGDWTPALRNPSTDGQAGSERPRRKKERPAFGCDGTTAGSGRPLNLCSDGWPNGGHAPACRLKNYQSISKGKGQKKKRPRTFDSRRALGLS